MFSLFLKMKCWTASLVHVAMRGIGFAYTLPKTRNGKSSHMFWSPAEPLLLWFQAKQTSQECGKHHSVLCWRAIWRVRPPPKYTVSICPKIVSDSGYGQTVVGGEWFRMSLRLTTTVFDHVYPPHLISTNDVWWQTRLIYFLCTVGWNHADADCSCLFAESHWLNLANSIAFEPAWLGGDRASCYEDIALWVHGICCSGKTKRN